MASDRDQGERRLLGGVVGATDGRLRGGAADDGAPNHAGLADGGGCGTGGGTVGDANGGGG